MSKKFTLTRLIFAICSMALEQLAIFTIWRWLLPAFDINLHVGIVIGVMLGWFIFGIWMFIFTSSVLEKKQHIGQTTMVGTTGQAVGKLSPEGTVKIDGELWGAISEEGEILHDEDIIVTGEEGLQLLVRKAPKH